MKTKHAPNSQWVKEEITIEILKYFEINENKTEGVKPLRCSESSIYMKLIAASPYF